MYCMIEEGIYMETITIQRVGNNYGVSMKPSTIIFDSDSKDQPEM